MSRCSAPAIAQPTLSLQIKQLEEELGTPFFDRIGKRVRLTDAGRVFREHARRALREMEDAQIAINELEGLMRGALTVGVVQTVNAYLVPEIVTRLSAEWPAVQIKVEELANDKIEEGLIEGRLNVGVGFIPTTAVEIVAEPLFDEDLVLIVSDKHKFASRKHVPVRELNGEPQQAHSATSEPRSDVRVQKTPDLILTSASVTYVADMDLLIFEQKVQGTAGGTLPRARGAMNGAPVPGYVFPTT